jgi:hypothetical protein
MAMKNSLEIYRRSLRECFLELLWRQWRPLGVASHGPESVRLIDLEALILATAMAAGQDRRLWDSALQWLSRCREWVNWARLKRMAVPFTRPDEWLKQSLIADSVWRQAVAALDPMAGKRQTAENVGKADRVLTPPRLRKPPLLQLLLRGIFGVNARAELILFLLAAGKGNSNQIARESHYDQKNIYVILERWAEAGFVDKEKQGKQNLYSLKQGFAFLLPAEIDLKFWRWEPLFLTFGRLFIAVHAEPWSTDPYLLSSLFRGLHRDVSPLARMAGIALPELLLHPGEELFTPMAEALPKIPAYFS